MLKKQRCGAWRAATDALGILTRSPAITGMTATGTISAGLVFTAAATMAAALVRAGREHRSGRSGIAADQPIGHGLLDRSDGLHGRARAHKAPVERATCLFRITPYGPTADHGLQALPREIQPC